MFETSETLILNEQRAPKINRALTDSMPRSSRSCNKRHCSPSLWISWRSTALPKHAIVMLPAVPSPTSHQSCVQMYVHMCIKQEASNRFGSRHTSRYTRCAIGEDCPNETMIRETLVGWSTGVKGPKLFRMTVHLKMTYHGITYEMYECV